MLIPTPCGPLSAHVHALLLDEVPSSEPLARPAAAAYDDLDLQRALWVLYELSFRGFDDVDDALEWDPTVVGVRLQLEAWLEDDLRRATASRVGDLAPVLPVGEQVLAMAAAESGPSVAAYLHRHAPREHVVDYLRERSVQQLKESDPQSFMLPRLEGAAKTALAEVQYDEFGAGRPERLHQTLYATALRAAGLDDTYGAYLEDVSALSLALANLPAMLAINRRLLPAAAGHFAVFEASSSVPSRKLAAGIERVGLDPAVADYFLEHVEADAVHEQVVARDLCGGLVEQTPSARGEVIFGAAACLELDARSGAELLGRWDVAQRAAS